MHEQPTLRERPRRPRPGIVHGEIVVRRGTVATDAHQPVRNLLLSPDAEADSRPWLQILADDVRCTHGASTGRLDDDAVFYLRSRGIALAAARAMLIDAFVYDITDAITNDSVRAHVTSLIAATHAFTAVTGEESPARIGDMGDP